MRPDARGAIATPTGSTPVDRLPAARAGVSVRTGRARTVCVVALAVVLLAGSLALVAFRLLGGEWFIVQSPSMGTALPVGALVVDVRTPTAQLADGDVITFDPPGAAAVHTHRIVGRTAAGFHTRGDVNAVADPWVVPDSAVRGRVAAVLPGAGWALRALPLLLAGGTVVWIATRFVRRRDLRAAVVMVGLSATISLATVLLHPFTNVVLMTATSDGTSSIVSVVATGMLPVRVQSAPGHAVDLADGQVGQLLTPLAHGAQRIELHTALNLPPAGWLALLLLCAAPLLASVVLPMLRARGRAA